MKSLTEGGETAVDSGRVRTEMLNFWEARRAERMVVPRLPLAWCIGVSLLLRVKGSVR